jgi:hypothetical protein
MRKEYSSLAAHAILFVNPRANSAIPPCGSHIRHAHIKIFVDFRQCQGFAL